MPEYKKVRTSIKLDGRSTFINTAADMRWLREVHLPQLPKVFKSALIFGNEDGPERIQAYRKRDPDVYDEPAIYLPDEPDEPDEE